MSPECNVNYHLIVRALCELLKSPLSAALYWGWAMVSRCHSEQGAFSIMKLSKYMEVNIFPSLGAAITNCFVGGTQALELGQWR